MEEEISQVVTNLLTKRPITDLNRRYLSYLKNCQKFSPLVIYDIGASLGAYTKYCHLLFPDSKIVLFEADDVFERHYTGEDYNIVCLSDTDKEVKFYNNPKNEDNYEVNSCYKSTVLNDDFKLLNARSLDNFILSKGISHPDLIKIACNGSELDIIKGGVNTIKRCKYLVVRLQNYELFKEAPLASTVGPYIIDLGFELLDVLDSYGNRIVDYVFKNKNI
jgi:FkbM family methyltransferase